MSLLEYRPNNEGRRGVLGRERAAGREEWQSAMRGVDGSLFAIPPAMCPREFVTAHFGPSSNMAFLRGTTTLAFSYEGLTEADKGGICVAADSRASSATYVSSKTVCKILDIAPHMVATMAGGAADCQYWIRQLAKTASLYELEHDHAMSVAAASKHLANTMYYFKDMGLSMGSMVAGFDTKGPSIYYVDQDGVRLAGHLFSVGSGCLNAISVLDSHYKPKMTDEEAKQLAIRAICHATFRDAGSGGLVRVCQITQDGKKYIQPQDVSETYRQIMAEKETKEA